MGRKNSKVRRSNDKGRLARRQRGERNAPAPRYEQPRLRVEDLVLPDGQCRFQTPRRPKARFATEEKARKALAQAQQQRARTGSTYVEKRYYKCPEGGCGGWHLSSRESFDEKVWKQRREQHEAKFGMKSAEQ